MKNISANQDRRRFVKRVLGIGALVWMTPTILSVSANKGHACLSGYNSSDRQHQFSNRHFNNNKSKHEPKPKNSFRRRR